MSNPGAAIDIDDLWFRYGEREILRRVQLTIQENDSICIVGPNGGGKTTLMKLIIGLLKPQKGEVRIFGKKVENGRRLIGYVPQYADYDKQFPIAVRDVVSMGRLGGTASGRFNRTDRELAMAALSEVGLVEHADSSFASLSGGQRQRVLIARALATGGKILILDEPTANIDRESESHFFELLEELNQRMTILMVTHDVGFASKIFKRIACVNREVVIHPTSELTGQLIKDMYGGDLHMIRHDHTCSEEGHSYG
jgi:zinc transport system ATP-binding protein